MFHFHNFLLPLTALLLLLGNSVIANNRCTEKCGSVNIQFPFHLKNNKFNDTTGYPQGFDLSCTDEDETVLELPAVPVKLFIKNIDYESQKFQIYDPKNCLSSQLFALGNSSVSPFDFQFQQFVKRNVSFFRCNSKACSILQRDSGADFIAPELVSCTKVSEVLSVQWMVEESEDDLKEILTMEWSKPNCSYCESQGQNCKWKNGTKGETECFVCPSNGISRSTVLLITAGMYVISFHFH